MKEIIKIIDGYKNDLIEDISKLVSYESVAVEDESDFPFGEEVQKAFLSFLDMGIRDGFSVKNVDNYGGHIEFTGDTDEVFAILGHIDVVPAGDGWNTNPFEAKLIDGKLYGRGTVDDKGPTMAAYYAMKALKMAGFKPKKTIRLILGLDEETNWKGIKYYLDREKLPHMGFSPDADFPVIHCEKGVLIFDIKKNISLKKEEKIKLVSIKGGSAPNMVADKCQVVIEFLDEKIKGTIEKYFHIKANNNKYDYELYSEGKTLTLVTKGVSAHGAMPHMGVNAISVALDLLEIVKFDNEDITEFIKFYNANIGFNLHGEKLSKNFEDEVSGKLIFNVGKIDIEEEIKLTINIRYPVSFDSEEILNAINLPNENYKIIVLDNLEPLYVSKDSALIKTMLESYLNFVEDEKPEPIVIGGATYARTIPNCVAFGPIFKGQEAVEHQPNEYIEIDKLLLATKIYADTIYNLCK